ncbi:hybrid sensor histidine kinase/response regulator transcription factor [Olivibacter domesticus]|uniref:histidine kinase n=1 Tax=Olivibacter domesticus TaxID=407022 RepID=A0A1H7MEN9_OLID1|nr:hybrid sensor histidine kinase/response regulator transcription factor [Olivibacter domesticus]SEL09561.1 Signal transduction histidine kinase [Olivibacter domesticus]
MMRSHTFRYAILVILCLYCFLGAADGYELPTGFKSYSAKDGLSSNTIYGIWKDSFGFLWLATEDGLNRFDGTNFKVYRHNPQQEGSLRANHITTLYEGADGCLWIGTNGGALSFYDRGKDAIMNYRGESLRKKFSTAITSIGDDSRGNIWVASYGALYIFDPQTKKLVDNEGYAKLMHTFSGKNALVVFKDKKQQMWIGTDSGLYVYNHKLELLSTFKHSDFDKQSLADDYVTSIVEDGMGNLWVGTMGGLSRLEKGKWKFRNYHSTTAPLKISSDKVYALAPDGVNGLWVGTDEGLDVLDVLSFSVQSFRPDKRSMQSLSSRSIRSIFIDKAGIYWIGTYQGGLNKYDKNLSQFNLKECNIFDPYGLRSSIVTAFAAYGQDVFVGTDGGGLHLYDRSSNLLQHIEIPRLKRDCAHDLSILAMEMGHKNRLWLGTYMDGLFSYDPVTKRSKQYVKGKDEDNLNHADIFCLKEDRKGNLWIGTNGGGVNLLHADSGHIEKFVHTAIREDDPDQPASNYIRSIEEDRDGRILIGTFGSGISIFHPESKKFSFYNKANSALPSNYVLTIKEDREGNIWVGTAGNGVGYLKRGSRKFITLSENDGLINGVVQKILEDNSGKLWFSTNKGLSSYDVNENSFKNYSHHAGLQVGAFVLGSGLCLGDGEIFFGGQKGFNHFNPTQLKINKNVPPVILTDLKIDNQRILPSKEGPISISLLMADEIRLRYKQNFSVSFEALNFTVAEENRYRYKLEGFDKNWIAAGREHSAYYTNLDPGAYTFHVQASNNDGVWNKEGRSIRIVVAPPFWRTIYAYIAYIVVIGGVLLYLRHQGIKKLEAKFALEQERLQAKQLLEQERKEAEHLHQLDRMKIKFLTNLSHEFRTPISLIMGPVDHLIGQIREPGQSSQLNLIKRNSRRLLNLVNQLLDFRKMEEKELKLQCSSSDFVSFIEEVSDSFNDLASRKKIEYAFYTSLSSTVVQFDHDKIERILFNLLSNAFKFTPEGGAVSLSLEEIEANVGDEFISLHIAVKDSGIGIPKEAQQRVFDSFFQHDAGVDVLNQGTGIGLSIARTFVNMHGGELRVASALGKGSVFSFDVRLKRVVQALEKAADPIGRRINVPSLQKDAPIKKEALNSTASVLIVEDDDDFRFYIKDNLKSFYQVLEASDGKEGWQRALFHHPDIIVCDIQMPIMNGLMLVQKLKSDKRTKHIPVILLTASSEENSLLLGLESGATDYMTKPFDFAVLQTKIANLLSLNQAFKDTYSKQISITVPEEEIVSGREKFLQKVVAYIHENMRDNQLSVENLSAHLFISRASLYNRLLEFTGMTPVEFIRVAKLERAVYLLEKSGMNVAEVAYETGFANPNYFTKVFKAKYQLTPSEFIHSVAKNKGVLT